jgi:hypothetical protein
LKAHRVYSAKTERSTGTFCGQMIALDGFYTKQHYPVHLRRIHFKCRRETAFGIYSSAADAARRALDAAQCIVTLTMKSFQPSKKAA